MITVNITQADINEGTIGSLSHGPVSLALRRAGIQGALVGLHTLRYLKDGVWMISALPLPLIEFQKRLASRERDEVLELNRRTVKRLIDGKMVEEEKHWHTAESFSIPEGVPLVDRAPQRVGRRTWGSLLAQYLRSRTSEVA